MRLGALLLLLLATPCILAAQDLQKSLQTEYQGKMFRIRGFYEDADLHFGQDGTLLSNGHPGSWTLAAIEIKKLKLNQDSVEITGQRVVEIVGKSGLQPSRIDSKIKIKIDEPTTDQASVRASLPRVLMDPKEPIVDLVPEYWHGLLQRIPSHHLFAASPAKQECADATLERPCRVGGKTKPPHPLSTPDPAYNELAKQKGYQGTSVLWLVVDENGTPQNVEIARALGFGLDEQAVKTVSHWKFQAATRDGKPVPVQINVEVNFRMY